MRISDWSSDVCSSDLPRRAAEELDGAVVEGQDAVALRLLPPEGHELGELVGVLLGQVVALAEVLVEVEQTPVVVVVWVARLVVGRRLPAVRPDAALTHLLAVLPGARRRGPGIGHGRRVRSSVARCPGHTVE